MSIIHLSTQGRLDNVAYGKEGEQEEKVVERNGLMSTEQEIS